jgi:hypothetical protein
MVPFRVPGPARAVRARVAARRLPLVQFTRPSESLSGRGIVVSVGRSPLDLRLDDGVLGVFPRPPARCVSQHADASLVDFALLQGAFPNRTAGLACRYSPGSRQTLTTCSSGHSPEVWCPFSASNAGSDPHRVCLARLCCALGLSQTLDASLRLAPCRPCFMPTALMGFPLQRFPFPVAHATSRPRCPSRRFRTAGAALKTRRPRSSPRVRRRAAVFALRGLGSTGNPFFRPGGVSHLAGADPLLGFQLFRVLPPAALAPPSGRLLPCPSSPRAPKRASGRDSGVFRCHRIGWPLARLPTLLSFPSSSRVVRKSLPRLQ